MDFRFLPVLPHGAPPLALGAEPKRAIVGPGVATRQQFSFHVLWIHMNGMGAFRQAAIRRNDRLPLNAVFCHAGWREYNRVTPRAIAGRIR